MEGKRANMPIWCRWQGRQRVVDRIRKEVGGKIYSRDHERKYLDLRTHNITGF